MSNQGFERPGGLPHPEPTTWPYTTPASEPSSGGADQSTASPVEVTIMQQGSGRSGRLGTALLAAVLGALLGGIVVAGVLRTETAPEPIPITLETFPDELLGADRNDLELRDAGFGPTVERMDAEFEEQLAAFRFAHGGDGATLGYGWLISLTIVDGIIAPSLPREGEVNGAGRAQETRRLVSLKSSTTSCIFEPRPVFNLARGMDDVGDFQGDGRTECVLVDRERNLSLRLVQNKWARDSDAFETATLFRDELERLHAQLIA